MVEMLETKILLRMMTDSTSSIEAGGMSALT